MKIKKIVTIYMVYTYVIELVQLCQLIYRTKV